MAILNKRGLVFAVFFLILLSTSVLAAVNETEQTNQAYNWLSNSSRDKWTNMSVEDNALVLLALSYDDGFALQGKNALIAKSNNSECWPSSNCKIKDTALATFALSKICVDTEKSQDWLMNKNATPTDLIWYLQTDTPVASSCSVAYDSKEYKFSIAEDKKLSNAAGSCLTLSFGSYWFKIASSCLDKTFTVSCDQDFAATLVYQKPADSTYYVSSDTKKESASGFADLKISAICIKEGFSCSYEGTLLTALALQDRVDKNLFLPYLIAYADKNTRYFPEAYLLKFSGLQDYANQLFDMQKSTGYWLAASSINGKYYDTALALNALSDFSSEKTERAKTWLLNEQVKTGNNAGSWQASKKDTAFVLYSLWPKEASCVSNTGEGGTIACEASGRYCMSSGDCNSEDTDEGHLCYGFDVCCNEKKQLKTCAEAGGIPCDYSLYCDGYTLQDISDISYGKQCCSGTCTQQTESVSDCEQKGYYCSQGSCLDSEEPAGYSCNTNSETCCMDVSTETTKSGFNWWGAIIIIIILAVVLFLLKGKLGKSGTRRDRRGMPPAGGMPPGAGFGPPAGFARPMPGRPMPARPMQTGMPTMNLPRGAVRPAFTPRASLKKTETDKELDATLKKLKEISK